MWTSESNSDKKFDNFLSLFGNSETAGSWQQDYEVCCSTQNITPCPFFKEAKMSSSSSCRLINAAVDLANWRAMLVAASTKNSAVTEIVCHNVRLTKYHITDLISFVKASNGLEVLKLDYVDFEIDDESFTTSLLPLLAECTNVKYISLKGNNLDNAFLSSLCNTIILLPCLEGLNLSENNIDDEGVMTLFRIFPFCICLRQVSMRKNKISGEGLQNSILDLVQGQLMSPEGEQYLKSMAKIVADKNKQIQSVNKGRKKAGLPEFAEIVSSNRIVTNAGEESRILNRNIFLLDFSHCAFNSEIIKAFIDSAAESTKNAAVEPEDAGPIMIRVRGVNDEIKSILREGGDSMFSGKLLMEV